MGYGLGQWGYEAVTTFIVLSGFCLGLQLERSRNVLAFMGRRSRRLLPPYFAALAVLCLLVMAKALRSGIWLQFPTQRAIAEPFHGARAIPRSN
jgi:peptidoglycan/LPS O-acetylase OafA/YrhL